MTILCLLLTQLVFWGSLFVGDSFRAAAAEKHDPVTVSLHRQAKFELTFANRDLIWFGDASSPTARLAPKPGVRPIATDFWVVTVSEDHRSRGRHYMREARIASDMDTRKVYAFTKQREKLIGDINVQGRFAPNDFYMSGRKLLPTWPIDASVLKYDSKENSLYCDVAALVPLVTESLDFLPLELSDSEGNVVIGRFSIDFAPGQIDGDSATSSAVTLVLHHEGESVILARASVPSIFCRSDADLGSFDNKSGTYLPEANYRVSSGGRSRSEPSVTVSFNAEFTSAVLGKGKSLTIAGVRRQANGAKASQAKITIDGNFDDWRNVAGVDDRRGDVVPYLEYVPDVDILEFKVAHDDEHICLYVRVAGQVGRTHPDGGRGYFYAYMDVDQNPNTGFLPSRDDECYYGVDIGDDCEIQFEFVNNAFRKTFYGFCGLGGDDNVLKQQLTIGKSHYGRIDDNGVERANYKSEYTYRKGMTEITEDLKLGSSDTIRLAISPDGHEVEIASTFTGFLKDFNGRPTVKLGQTIDLAAGMECDSKAYPGKSGWAADNTIAIRGYRLSPSVRGTSSTHAAAEK